MAKKPPKPYDVAVGKRLVQYREALWPEATATWYAKQAGIGKTAYQNYESGERLIHPEKVIKLERRHGITLAWVYKGDVSGLPHAIAMLLST